MLKVSGQSDPDLQRYLRKRYIHRQTHRQTEIPCFYREMLCLADTKHFTSLATHHPHHEAMWWQHHAVGMLLNCVRLVKVEGKMNAAKYRELLEDNLIQSAREL